MASLVPDEFEVRTIVLLLLADDPPDLGDDEAAALQQQHLAYGASLRERGLTVVQGPVVEGTDERVRGLTVFTVGPEEAKRLADEDPAVKAGRLTTWAGTWWTESGRVAFPQEEGRVGEVATPADLLRRWG